MNVNLLWREEKERIEYLFSLDHLICPVTVAKNCYVVDVIVGKEISVSGLTPNNQDYD